MSADNYYVVRKHPEGGFTYLMGFASNGEDPELDDPRGYKLPRFASMELAWQAATAEGSEYGVDIHPECWSP